MIALGIWFFFGRNVNLTSVDINIMGKTEEPIFKVSFIFKNKALSY